MVLTEARRRQLEKELREIEAKELRLLEKKLEHKRTHGAEYWKPLWYQQKVIDYLHGGKKVVLLQGGNQCGKEQPIYSLVYTPKGGMQIGSLKVGDFVFGEDGNKYKIDGIYPQGVKPVYRLTFNDESYTDCGLDHLWKVRTPGSRFRKTTRHGNHSFGFEKWQILTLKEILNRWGANPTPRNRIAIPMCEPVEFESDYNPIISPYLLGLLIGDGSLANGGIGFSTSDLEIIEYIKQLLPKDHKITWRDKYDWTISGFRKGGKNGATNIILNEIRKLGLNKTSDEKFIPNEYKYLTSQQRIELLRGLMDTDGSIYGKGTIEFSTISKKLAHDVQWLIQSLGGQVKLSEKHFKYQYKDNPVEEKISYRLIIRIEGLNPFKLKRKAEKYYKTRYRKERLLYRIEYVGHHECVCISVDSKDHTYLTDSFIVTHNTLTGSAIIDSCMRGVQAWDGKPSIFGGRVPVKGRIICSSWESHAKETLIPKLKETLFVNEYETTKNNMGVEAFWRHKKTGSQFTIMTHTQDTIAHESDTFDIVWADEPLPRDKYTANIRGLVARDGVFLMTMTSISQAWIYREIYQKQNDESKKIGCVAGINIRENKYLTEEAIKRFEESCTAEEREARIQGGWLQLTGLIWPQFKRDQHVIKPFKVPPLWPVVAMIDPHFGMEFVVNYFAVSPMGRRYMIDEDWLAPNPKFVAHEIIRKKKVNAWRLERCYIDPLAKGDSDVTTGRFGEVDDIFTTMRKELNPFEILIDEAKRSHEHKMSGIVNIRTWLIEEWGEPTLFFFNNCEKSVEEIEMWAKDKNGNPIDEDDHACENLYRFSLTNTRYTEPATFHVKPRKIAGVI